MADPLSISLRSWPEDDRVRTSLPYLIARINEQRGSFRNITEASLEEEIRAAEAGEDNGEDAKMEDDGEDDNGPQPEPKDINKARDEILKGVKYKYLLYFADHELIAFTAKPKTRPLTPSTSSPFSSPKLLLKLPKQLYLHM